MTQRIYTANGTLAGEYHYDAWGNILNESTLTEIAKLNPFRYRGYYYDSESGLYYLNSRYYDPETGRFINADGYVSTGQGIEGYNMFVYALNNPIAFCDPSGNLAVGCSTLRGDRIRQAVEVVLLVKITNDSNNSASLPYETADEAAMAFANSTYSSSSYIRHEYGTVIYSSTTNETTTYDFAIPVAGSPHSVGYGNVKIPPGTTIVATAHTHPNSNSFSGLEKGATSGDIPNAIRRGLDSYVIGPNLILQKYSVSIISSGVPCDVGVARPVTLTSWQQTALVSQFQISWGNHLGTCDFGCEHMTWPTP